jgi:transaldolase
VKNAIQQLYENGQSVWCDQLNRDMIESGELQRLLDLGVVGVTSNPTIFMNAITGGHGYDRQFDVLLGKELDTIQMYERLVLPDIAGAADLLWPVYKRTGGVDGYVSLEVNPKLAYDTAATVTEARRLFRTLERPNVFIKVPATNEGIPAMETLIAEGINVNVTLIFSIAMYEQVMLAYFRGLQRREAMGGDLSRVSSVASFFVSRVDTLVDQLLEVNRATGVRVDHLLGRAAVANAKAAYVRFCAVFGGEEFRRLADRGARPQRPLWASTSTKNPAYSPTKYVDELVGPHTVNTMPPKTIEAVLENGCTEVVIDQDLPAALQLEADLRRVGIDMAEVTDRLRVEGVEAFVKSFDELLDDLEQKQALMRQPV